MNDDDLLDLRHDDDPDDEPGGSLERLLQALDRGDEPLAADLPALSALDNQATARVGRRLDKLPAERRGSVFQRLAAISEDIGYYDFTSIFRLGIADPEERVRVAALDGLWEVQDRWLLRALLEILETDPSASVRALAAQSLGRYVVMAEFEELTTAEADRLREALRRCILRFGEDLGVRSAAVEALGADSDLESQKLVGEQFVAGARPLRLGAIRGMGRSMDARWLPLLVPELASEDDEIRFEAVTALGHVGDPSVVTAILPLVGDEDAEVQMAAVAALGEIGGAIAMRELNVLAESENEVLAAAAQEALENARADQELFGFSLN